jgi:hypothetical protein
MYIYSYVLGNLQTQFWIGWLYLLHLTHLHISGLHAIQRCRYSAHFPVHQYAIRFSVFTGCILAVDLSQSNCNFKSHVKSSSHSLILFLPFLLNHLRLPSPELDSVPLLAAWDPHYSIILRQTPWKTPSSIIKDVCLLVHYLIADILFKEMLLCCFFFNGKF